MSAKDFLLRFLGVIVAGMIITLVFTYLEIRKYDLGEFADTPIDQIVLHRSDSGQEGGNQNNTGQSPSSISDTWAPPENRREEKYPVDEYPVSFSATGALKLTGAASIMLTTDSGDGVDAIVTGSTEVLRNGQRVKLEDIKPTDRVTLMGRKKTESGNDFVVDSIYATEITDDSPIPVTPIELPAEE